MKPKIDPDAVRFFSGQSNLALAEGITRHLGVPLAPTEFRRFANDNLSVQLGASVRGRKVYIIQSLTRPTSDHLLQLLMMIDIARNAAAHEIHAIIPHFSYARSDKKDAPRISITARLVADLLATAGVSRVMTMQLHSPQVHGFFSVPTDPLTARGLFVKYLKPKIKRHENPIVVAPDAGIAKSAARLASLLKLPVAVAAKKRYSDTKVSISKGIRKQVKGHDCAIIYDDEIATGTSVIELCKTLEKSTIQNICVVCTHGLFVGDALTNLSEAPYIEKIVTTDTVPIPNQGDFSKLKVLSVAETFGEAIAKNYHHESIGSLFTFWEKDE